MERIEAVITATELFLNEDGDRAVRVTISEESTGAEFRCVVSVQAAKRFAPGRRVLLTPKVIRD